MREKERGDKKEKRRGDIMFKLQTFICYLPLLATCTYMTSNCLLFFSSSRTFRKDSHKNFTQGISIIRSVLSCVSSPLTVLKSTLRVEERRREEDKRDKGREKRSNRERRKGAIRAQREVEGKGSGGWNKRESCEY